MSFVGRIGKVLAQLTGRTTGVGRAGAAPAVGRKELRKHLVEALHPILSAEGFGRFEGYIARRQCADWVDVVQLRFDVDYEEQDYGLVVEVGRHFLLADISMWFGAVSRRNGEVWPDITDCHFRKFLFRCRAQWGNNPRNVWSIGLHGERLEKALSDVTRLVEEETLPWFVWISDLSRVLDLTQDGIFDSEGKNRDAMLRGMNGCPPSWGRAVLGAFLAFRLQRWEQCISLVEPVLRRGGTLNYRDALIPLEKDALQRLKRLMEDARAAAASAS